MKFSSGMFAVKRACSLGTISYVYPQVEIPALRRQEFPPVHKKQ